MHVVTLGIDLVQNIVALHGVDMAGVPIHAFPLHRGQPELDNTLEPSRCFMAQSSSPPGPAHLDEVQGQQQLPIHF